MNQEEKFENEVDVLNSYDINTFMYDECQSNLQNLDRSSDSGLADSPNSDFHEYFNYQNINLPCQNQKISENVLDECKIFPQVDGDLIFVDHVDKSPLDVLDEFTLKPLNYSSITLDETDSINVPPIQPNQLMCKPQKKITNKFILPKTFIPSSNCNQITLINSNGTHQQSNEKINSSGDVEKVKKAKKMMRNRIAAAKSRENKKKYLNLLESKLTLLQESNSALKERNSLLVNEVNQLKKENENLKLSINQESYGVSSKRIKIAKVFIFICFIGINFQFLNVNLFIYPFSTLLPIHKDLVVHTRTLFSAKQVSQTSLPSKLNTLNYPKNEMNITNFEILAKNLYKLEKENPKKSSMVIWKQPKQKHLKSPNIFDWFNQYYRDDNTAYIFSKDRNYAVYAPKNVSLSKGIEMSILLPYTRYLTLGLFTALFRGIYLILLSGDVNNQYFTKVIDSVMKLGIAYILVLLQAFNCQNFTLDSQDGKEHENTPIEINQTIQNLGSCSFENFDDITPFVKNIMNKQYSYIGDVAQYHLTICAPLNEGITHREVNNLTAITILLDDKIYSGGSMSRAHVAGKDELPTLIFHDGSLWVEPRECGPEIKQQSMFVFVCPPDEYTTGLRFSGILKIDKVCYNYFKVYEELACNESNESISTGSILLITLFVIIIIYVIGTCVKTFFFDHYGFSDWILIRHVRCAGSLIADGVLYICPKKKDEFYGANEPNAADFNDMNIPQYDQQYANNGNEVKNNNYTLD
ncbi:hypothetical protein A3Q56_01686 [Intoshia linei]|uniref:BZIP domain-containing protein n=1 Tax=Intoshia linei TaxID=1819745 RepID=A0A177B8V3_9BILA|nr:hypothetical protein A3Q56_01686 [Intoshia linei]